MCFAVLRARLTAHPSLLVSRILFNAWRSRRWKVRLPSLDGMIRWLETYV